jgi:hypothetical protein
MVDQVAEFMRGEGYDVRTVVDPGEDQHAQLLATGERGTLFLEIWENPELPIGSSLEALLARGRSRAAADEAFTRSAVVLPPGDEMMPAEHSEPLALARTFIVRFDPSAWTMRPA